MALITGLGLIVVSILTAALSKILAEEMSAWNPSIIRRLIKLAVGRLPEGRRERFQEEWQSHVNEVPGQIGKLLVAAGLLFAAYKVALNDLNRARERGVSTLALVDEALSNATTLVNLMESDEDLGFRERANQARLTLSEIQENRNRLATLYAATPDTWLTLIFKLLHPGTEASVCREKIEHQAKQIKELNSEFAKRLGELKRMQDR